MKSASATKNKKGFSEWVQALRETFMGNTVYAQS